jgi:hypothetical protein
MKQETLEESAERLYPMYMNEYLWYIPIQKREGFIEGARWQQEQIFNLIKELHDNENITGFSKLAYAKCLDIVEQFKKK